MPELNIAYVQCDVSLAYTPLQYKATDAQLGVTLCLPASAAYIHVWLSTVHMSMSASAHQHNIVLFSMSCTGQHHLVNFMHLDLLLLT